MRWPSHARDGGHAGALNEGFLDAGLLDEEFLGKLKPYREQVAVLMFEFGMFAKSDFPSPEIFYSRLEGFLGSLPHGGATRWRSGIRNTWDQGTSRYLRGTTSRMSSMPGPECPHSPTKWRCRRRLPPTSQ